MPTVDEAFKKFKSRLELSSSEQQDASRRQKRIREMTEKRHAHCQRRPPDLGWSTRSQSSVPQLALATAQWFRPEALADTHGDLKFGAMRYWIWVFSEIDALRAVIESREMHFRNHASDRLAGMSDGDKVVLYTTQAAYGSPHSDVSRVAGLAEVAGKPRREPFELLGHKYAWQVSFRPIALLPERQGPGVKELVPNLPFIRYSHAWGSYFRPSPVSIGRRDFKVFADAVDTWEEENSRSVVRP